MNQKIWSKTLLNCYPCLERIAGAIDGLVLTNGLHSGCGYYNTLTSANKIIELIDRKKILINLKVLTEKIIEKMSVEYARILVLKFFDRVKSEDIAKIMGLSHRNYFRKLNQAINSFATGLVKFGFTAVVLEKTVEKEEWIKDVYDSILRKELVSRKNNKDVVFSELKLLNLAFSGYKKINSYRNICC